MKRLFLPLPAILFSITLMAQENRMDTSFHSLPDVTIIGKRMKELPGSGQIISKEKLGELNQTDITKVVATIPGVYVREEDGFGLRPNIGLRGTGIDRSAKITLMEDGVLIAPAPYSAPSAYYFPTFSRMEGIEVLKGSSQIKYGPYTIGGAVNLLSTSIPKSFAGHAELSYGSFGTNKQRVWVGDSRKNFDYVFEINRFAGNGFKKLDNGGDVGFDRRDMMGKLRWHTSAEANTQQSLTLKVLNSTELSRESYLGLTYNDFESNANRRYAATQKDILDMSHVQLSLNHDITLSKNLNISTTAYYNRTFRDWARVSNVGGVSVANIIADPTTNATSYQIMTGKANGNIDYDGAPRNFTAKGVQTNLSYKINTGERIQHQFKLGVRYHEDEVDRYATRSVYAMTNGSMVLTTAGVKGNRQNQNRSASSFASYLQYELTMGGLSLTPGIRYENISMKIEDYGRADTERLGTNLKTAENKGLSVLLPGLGINYAFNEKASLFGGVHRGFSPPGTPVVDATAQAKAETATNFELGYRYNNEGLNAQIVGFLSNYDNLLGSDNLSGGGLGSGEMFNAGNAKIQGVEVSVEYNLLPAANESGLKLPLSVAYTYTDARFKGTFVNGGGDWGTGVINAKDIIPFIQPNLLAAALRLENRSFNATLTSRFVGDTRIKPGAGTKLTAENNVSYNEVNSIKKYMVFDLSANYRLHKNFSVYTLVSNIFNKEYIVANLPIGYRPGLPVSFNVGLKLNIM